MFSINDAEGRFLRQYRGKGYAARVTIDMQPTTGPGIITVRCTGTPLFRQGAIEEVPAEGWDDWKAGAVTGVQYALTRANQLNSQVVINRILGTFTDTHPSIIALAAAYAVWRTLGWTPTPEDTQYLESVALAGFASYCSHSSRFWRWLG